MEVIYNFGLSEDVGDYLRLFSLILCQNTSFEILKIFIYFLIISKKKNI